MKWVYNFFTDKWVNVPGQWGEEELDALTGFEQGEKFYDEDDVATYFETGNFVDMPDGISAPPEEALVDMMNCVIQNRWWMKDIPTEGVVRSILHKCYEPLTVAESNTLKSFIDWHSEPHAFMSIVLGDAIQAKKESNK